MVVRASNGPPERVNSLNSGSAIALVSSRARSGRKLMKIAVSPAKGRR